MEQSVSRIQWTGSIIFQITRSKEDNNFSFDNTETKRKKIKRGVFIFVGSASRILFGTLSDEDTTYYKNQNKRIRNTAAFYAEGG